jgi:hypothetical protein
MKGFLISLWLFVAATTSVLSRAEVRHFHGHIQAGYGFVNYPFLTGYYLNNSFFAYFLVFFEIQEIAHKKLHTKCAQILVSQKNKENLRNSRQNSRQKSRQIH